jgi:hypothetical protein
MTPMWAQIARYSCLVPFSPSARHAVEVAVRLNPDGARSILAILRTAPAAVKYKPQDRFGPLGMMVIAGGQPDRSPVPAGGFYRPSLPPEFHGQAETFQREWLARSFTKAELADALEQCLR